MTEDDLKDFQPKNYPSNANFKPSVPIRNEPVVVDKIPDNRPKVNKIVKGSVKTKKPTLITKFSNFFLGSDSKTVTEYVVQDIFVPAIKNTIVEAIYAVSDGIGNGFEMLFFGDRARGRRGAVRRGYSQGSGAGQTYYNYNSISAQQQPVRRGGEPQLRAQSVVARSRHKLDDIVIDSRADAEEVLFHLVDLVQDYGSASISDFFSLVGINTEYTDQQYGWRNLEGANVLRLREGGFVLNLPRPIFLD